MYRAVWKGAELAKSDQTIEVEGNQYFPKEDVNMRFLRKATIIQNAHGKD